MKTKVENMEFSDEGSYGQVIVRFNGSNQVFGSGDIFPQKIYSWSVTVGEVVSNYLNGSMRKLGKFSQKQINVMERFLKI